MNHSHSDMAHSNMDHSNMDHSNMDHSNMDHSNMDHSNMDQTSMDHSNMDHLSMDHGMKMYFHFSSQATILFAGWTTTTARQMFGSCLIMVLVAALYEGLKVLRDWLLQRSLVLVECNGDAIAVPTNDGEAPPLASGMKQATNSSRSHHRQCRMLSLAHVVQTLLHIIQVAISYALMLVFMTFNVWLCLSILAGAGLGYFLFCWRRVTVVDPNEHCH